jgi:hypothetical protein
MVTERFVLTLRPGRMKFCRPIFKAVGQVDSALAKEVFEKSKEAFHPIARRLIEKVDTPLQADKYLKLTNWFQDIGLA